jgi:predicted TIM-barrel fold metal-dependent hydrolase
MKRINNQDQLFIEGDEKVSGIGQISNAGKRFKAPEDISAEGLFDDVEKGGYDPAIHIVDMNLDGVSGEVLYPSQGLFYFSLGDSDLISAIFRVYNDWITEFCSHDRTKLKGIAMINLDNVNDGIKELNRCAKLGLSGAMISEFPGENKRYDQSKYEPFWAEAEGLEIPLTLHTATARHGESRIPTKLGLRQATARATKTHWVNTSLCDIIFSGIFDRYPRLKLVVAEFELAWVPYFLRSLDYGYIERQFETTYRFKDAVLPSDFFRNNISLSFQEDDLGIRMRDIIGVNTLMWGSDYPHAESTFPYSKETLNRILADVPNHERQLIVGGNASKLYGFITD